ncbi:MAG: 2-oxo-4-hydroxy-4-carboxy-5-ureidoimidazoline decarboxylase [Chloroflexota bacterium]|nr:2-oxo-4-hydroxy-4-carboxy-5-ureidoimidazoline decarboxylase [Chloroflexota bacterium]
MLPLIEQLNELEAADFERALAPLFEGAPRFVTRLGTERPYGSYEQLLERAEEIALTMPEQEKLELIDSHPRIGAAPASVSALSYREQGYDRAPASADPELQATLDRLNEAYEQRFGFRFVIFVAGRPRSAIVPIIEDRLGASRDEEKERALRDVIAIARDRLRKVGAG